MNVQCKVRPNGFNGFGLPFYILLLLPLFLLACDSKNYDPDGDGNYVYSDESFLYVTFTKQKVNKSISSKIQMKIPLDYVGLARDRLVTLYVTFPTMEPFKSAEREWFEGGKPSDSKSYDNLLSQRIPVSLLTASGVWDFRGMGPTSYLSYAGKASFGLDHYKWKGCEGKPFDMALITAPSTDGDCYSLNRSDYYYSEDLGSGRSIRIKCGIRCSVETAITEDGFHMGYSYYPEHLKYWQAIDKAIFELVQGFIVENKIMSDGKSEDSKEIRR